MAPTALLAVPKDVTLSPTQLSDAQTKKASKALLAHIVKDSKERSGKDLLDTKSPSSEAIWLILTTKKHLTTQERLKPAKIAVPHSPYTAKDLSICLITPNPQRAFKDAIADPKFTPAVAKRIIRVIDIEKLGKKYKTFEARRQLRDSHDLFMADDRIVTYLPKLLGKCFYDASTKRPIPVRLTPSVEKEERAKKNAALPSLKPTKKKETPDTRPIIAAAKFAHEIERTLSMTTVRVAPSVTTAIRLGDGSFTTEQLAENVAVVAAAVVEAHVGAKWNGVKAIHIKGANTIALPIWLADQLWEDETQVLEDFEVKRRKQLDEAKNGKRGKRKRLVGREAGAEDDGGGVALIEQGEAAGPKKRKRKGPLSAEAGASEKTAVDAGEGEKGLKRRKKEADDGMSQEMKERREKLRQQKRDSGKKTANA